MIESDNCASQYKSSHHFTDMQDLANKYGATVIRFFGIASHGKGEVDHVRGIAKVAVRQQVARGDILSNATEVKDFLCDKFAEKNNSSYHIHELTIEELDAERKRNAKMKYKTINGSSSFQVMVFKPNSAEFRAAPRLCICKKCQEEYGSCDLFQSYPLITEKYTLASLRSNVLSATTFTVDKVTASSLCADTANLFILHNSYVAVAAPESSSDTFWLIKVTDVDCCELEEKSEDGYGHIIPAGNIFMQGHFLEIVFTLKDSTLFKLSTDKKTFFYKESVVYPFVEMEEGKKGLVLNNSEYLDIIYFMESSGYAHFVIMLLANVFFLKNKYENYFIFLLFSRYTIFDHKFSQAYSLTEIFQYSRKCPNHFFRLLWSC